MFKIDELFSKEDVEAMNANKHLIEEGDNEELLDLEFEQTDKDSALTKEKVQNIEELKDKESKEDDLIDPSKLFIDTEDENVKNEVDKQGKKKVEENNKNNATLKVFAKYLRDEGIIEVEDDKLDTLESSDNLKEYLENTLKKREFSDLTDTQKEYLDLLRSGVDEETIKTYQINTNKLASVTDEDLQSSPQLQKNVYATLLKQKGFSEDKVAKLVAQSEAANALLDDSKDSLKELIENEKAYVEKIKSDNLAKQQADLNKQKALVTQIKETLTKGYKLSDDIKITPVEGEKILQSLKNPTIKVGDKQVNLFTHLLEQDPVGYRIKLHYLAQKGFFNKDTNLDFLAKNITTKKVNELDKHLASMSDQDITVSGGARKNTGTGIDSLLKAIDNY